MQQQQQQRSQNTLRFIRCAAAGRSFCLEMDHVAGIERAENMVVNSRNDGPVGWIPSRQGNIPLHSLARQLRLQDTQTNDHQVAVVMNSDKAPWALLVDQVSRVTEVSRNQVYRLPPVMARGGKSYFSSVLKLADELSLLLAPAYLRDTVFPSSSSMKFVPRVLAAPTRRNSRNRRLVVFSAGVDAVAFGLSVTQVAEILGREKILEIPGTGVHVLGITVWRDRPIPVVSLPDTLGLKGLNDKELPRMLVARGPGKEEYVAFPVEAIVRSLKLPVQYNTTTDPAQLGSPVVRAMVELENETLLVPDVSGILELS